jgi:excisionase family DNA binding protein
MTEERLYTLAEVARMLRVNYNTVRRLLTTGRLRGVRVGRRILVRSRDLEDYFERYPAYPEES